MSDPECEISLSYMDRLLMDCFSPTFRIFFWLKHKKSKQPRTFKLFTLWIYVIYVFLSGLTMGGNIVCTVLLTGKQDWSNS